MTPLNNFSFFSVPRSEDWRHSWCFRTCISVAAISFLFLYKPSETFLINYAFPPFCLFATVAVKDVTVGATIVNAWSCIWGCFIGSSIGTIILQFFWPHIINWDYDSRVGMSMLFLFLSAFVMQYMEIQPMGKKFGISLLPVFFISMINPSSDHQKLIWILFTSIVVGSIVAIVGAVIPLPPRMAGTEVRERLNYFTTTISSLMKNSTYSWLIQPVRAVDYFHPSSYPPVSSSKIGVIANCSKSLDNTTYVGKKLTRWKKLKLLVNAVAAFKRSKYYCIGWIHRSHHRAKDLYTRIEIIKFLQEELEVLVKRNVEARFGPHRTASIRLFGRFVSLSRQFLGILLQLEKQVQDLETQSVHYPIYRSFFLSPNFRRRYSALVMAICTGYEQLYHVLISNDYRYDEKLIVDAMMAMHTIVESKDLFNREYFRLRKSVYYNLHTSSMPTYGSTQIGKDRHSLFSEIVEFSKLSAGETNTEAHPLVSEVLFNMNTMIFLLEEAADMIIMFWKEDELNDAEDIVQYLKRRSNNGEHMVDIGFVNSNTQTNQNIHKSFRQSARSSLERFSTKSLQSFQRPSWKPRPKGINRYLSLQKWLAFAKKATIGVLNDLFPSQSHLLFFRIECHDSSNDNENLGIFSRSMRWLLQWQISWQWSNVIEERMKSALTVALAMTIGGFFGIYTNRPQAVMASFTIAYLSGGSVSGINIMTCLNRGAGTVLACVYSVTCMYIIEMTGMLKNSFAVRFFIGASIVLIQYPSTYVRSFPLYSYTGTCCGFTAALLLIEYFSLLDAAIGIAIHRIVDTFIAVFIYLVLELGLSAQMSEVTLISTLQKVVLGIEQRFSRIYSHISPNSAVSKPMKSIQPSPNNEDAKKLLEVDSMQALLVRQRDLLPFYKSEPRIASAPALPDRLLQEALHWQEQAVMSLQLMMWVVQSCDDDALHRQEHRIAEITTSITEIPDAVTGSSLHKTQLKLMNPLVLERRRSLSTRPRGQSDDTAEALLLPLETQYREVEVYISQALAFLTLSIQQLQRRPQDIPLEKSGVNEETVSIGTRLRSASKLFSDDIEVGNCKSNNWDQIAVGGGLVVNSANETIVPLDPVSQLRRIHQARNFQIIQEQQLHQKSNVRVRNRSVSSQRLPTSERQTEQILQDVTVQSNSNHIPFTALPTEEVCEGKTNIADVPDVEAPSASETKEIDSTTITSGDAEVEPSFGEAAKIPRRAAGTHQVPKVESEEHLKSDKVKDDKDISREVRAPSVTTLKPDDNATKPLQSRRKVTFDASDLEYIFFAEVESQQVECLFSSYQRLLESIQERIVEHRVLSSHEDVVVLGEEKVGASDNDMHKMTPNYAHSSRSGFSTHPAPSYNDSRFTPVHHPVTPEQHHHRPFHSDNVTKSYRYLENPGAKSSQPCQNTPQKVKNSKYEQTILRISSNKEIKVVNTLLNSTRDLLQALRSLSRVISRLQAHRDIRWTQDARKMA